MTKKLFEVEFLCPEQVLNPTAEYLELVLSEYMAVAVRDVTGQMAEFPTTEQMKGCFKDESRSLPDGTLVIFDTETMDG